MVVATKREREIYPPRRLHDEHMKVSEKISDIYSREGDLRREHRSIIGREDDLTTDHRNITSRADSLHSEHRSVYDQAHTAVTDQKGVLTNQVTLGRGHNAVSSRLDALEKKVSEIEGKVNRIYEHVRKW